MYLTVSAVADGERLRAALAGIAGEEPGVSINAQSDWTYALSGNSERHLESICDRLRGEYKCAIDVSPIKAVLLETIRGHGEAEGKYIRQTGGSGNYGHCKLRIEPNEPGKGYEFVNEIKGSEVPNEYIKPIDEGVQVAMENGILAGFPIVDVKVTLFDGSYHEPDSNEMAFKFAGAIAFKEAARKASPVVLEPVMAVELTVPEASLGTVIADINSRRGRIVGMENAARSQVIKAIVPLTEVLRASAQGRLDHPMQFAGYESTPRGGWSEGEGLGVTANNPKNPKLDRRGSASAGPGY